MRKMLIVALVLTMLPITAFSQAKITGDVRVRPRMDVTTADANTDAVTKNYVLYWGRLNVDADIGDGWSFHSKLATNFVGHWSGYWGENTQVGAEMVHGFVDRPAISWMEISMGKNAGNWGFKAGNLPLNGVANHIVDLHYYPTAPVDIPWAIYHSQSIQGINGFVNAGPGKLNFALAVDENLNTDEGDGLVNTKTLMADYGATFGGITVKPQMAMTMTNDSTDAPTTMGAGVSAKVAGFTLSGTYLMTSNTVEGGTLGKYDGTHIRAGVKGTVGPGFLLAWYDMATHTPDGGDQSDYSYIWVLYKYTIFSGDKGAIVVMPTARMRTGALGNADYSRNKFELTFQLNFK